MRQANNTTRMKGPRHFSERLEGRRRPQQRQQCEKQKNQHLLQHLQLLMQQTLEQELQQQQHQTRGGSNESHRGMQRKKTKPGSKASCSTPTEESASEAASSTTLLPPTPISRAQRAHSRCAVPGEEELPQLAGMAAAASSATKLSLALK
mmetsp:Transcript_18486/g.50905  ORF Transcript_18486/g.50905 Transcript_18486/m.50905 type:complete len:150 (-) Transcript_18486:125-574(-)